MSPLKSYKELIVWQRAIELVREVYTLTEMFPKSENYGIVSQMRRASVGIPSVIAEGYGRKSPKEYRQFYAIAFGSALELETQIIISKMLKFAHEDVFVKVDSLLLEVLRMLNKMMRSLKSSQLNARP